MCTRLGIFDERPMTGDPHHNPLLDRSLPIFHGVSRAIFLLDCDVSAVHKLCDTAKTQCLLFLELLDNRVQGRLRKSSRDSPSVLQYESLLWLRIGVIIFRSPKHPCSPPLQRNRLPNWGVMCIVRILPNFDFEARILCDAAEVVEGSDSWVESQFVGVHVTCGTTDNSNEPLEVVIVLEIVVLRDYRARAIKQADIEDIPAKSDVEGIPHEWSGSEVETSNVCDLTKN